MDFSLYRIHGVATRIGWAKVRSIARANDLGEFAQHEAEVIFRRACFPWATITVCKRIAARGHTINGDPFPPLWLVKNLTDAAAR